MRGRLQAVEIVFSLIVVIAVIAIAADLLQLVLLVREDHGDPVNASLARASDVSLTVVWWLQGAGLLAGAIAFILWLSRAYRSLPPDVRRYDTVWAGLGWFVPIWAYFRPVQIVNDVRRAVGGGLGGLVAAWWTLWLLERMWGLIASIGGINAEETNTQVGQMQTVLVDDVLVVAAATLALLVAARLTKQLDAAATRG